MRAQAEKRIAGGPAGAPGERHDLEQATDAILLFDEAGTILFANASAVKALEGLGVGAPSRIEDFPSQLQSALRASAARKRSELGECGDLPRGAWGVRLPVTELDAEWLRGMAEAEQMAAVGQLAAAVAQEIGGPNTSIQVTVDRLLETPLGKGEETHNSLKQILSQTERITRLTRQLIALADPGRARVASVDVNEIVESACELMESSFSARSIDLDPELPEGSVRAMADRNHLLQALVNLLLNARTAVQAWTGERRVRVRTEANTDRVLLHVEDSGPGIPPEDVSRIFLPFVSTTGGTGMGLFLTRQILVEQGGGIRVHPRNEMGGATFTVYLEKATDE